MGMYKCPDCLTEWFSGNGGHVCTVEFKKPKRTISLEAYIKMQNDWLILDKAIPEKAKYSVDEILKYNDVEVES